ncbi:MAG TPA: TIGR03000 domain-containing protein [Gemmataceae bacterium]|jgi:uncharacterized protein (TIGR03000 family)|nr:TIGR03000 domain-containing protein [Gemmataceae bacterium]
MIRTLSALLALAIVPNALGQIIRPAPGRPAGVIAPPALPIPGSLTPPGFTPARPLPRPYLAPNPYFNSWGFAPYWPAWYDSEPPASANLVPIPVPTLPAPMPVVPPPVPELRARLTLTVPNGATVWLAGKEVDANVTPLILESPVLQSGQSYTFNVKVTWRVSNKETEERARAVTVEAGESKSLAYFR